MQSGQAGSLSDCLMHLNKMDFVTLFTPPLSTPTSAVTPGGSNGENSHFIDTANRMKIIFHLISGLVASLVTSHNVINSRSNDRKTPILLLESAVMSLESIITVIVSMTLYIQDKDIESPHEARRRKYNTSLEKVPVKLAIQAVPSLVTVAVLLDDPISLLRKEYNSDGGWNFVEKDESNSNREKFLIEEQLRKLTFCQTIILQTTALLISKAMFVGGGEASTVILRDVVSKLYANNLDQNSIKRENTEDKNYLLCRLVSLILTKIVARNNEKDDPWKSVELCSATARLCDLVEEKKLLRKLHQGVSNINGENLSLDQVRLLCALIDIMEAGRENTGWCQIISPDSIQDQGLTSSNFLKKEGLSLVQILNSSETFKTVKFEDYHFLATTEQNYYLINNDNYASFEIFDRQKIFESTNTRSFITSKLLLPILQPSFRIVLGCLQDISSASIVQYSSISGNGGKSLLSIVIEEIRATTIAALVGLAFPHARDLCLSTLSSLRKGISYHEREGDNSVAIMYRDLFMTAVNEMCIRYESERKKREVAELFSYGVQTASPDAANSREVERLLLGNNIVTHNGRDNVVESGEFNTLEASDDFIVFPEGNQSDNKVGTIGWNGYKGFGSALEKCAKSLSEKPFESNDTMSILSPYLDTWDEKQLMEEEESELVELFDTNTSTQGQVSHSDVSLSTGIATAADIMTSYIGKYEFDYYFEKLFFVKRGL